VVVDKRCGRVSTRLELQPPRATVHLTTLIDIARQDLLLDAGWLPCRHQAALVQVEPVECHIGLVHRHGVLLARADDLWHGSSTWGSRRLPRRLPWRSPTLPRPAARVQLQGAVLRRALEALHRIQRRDTSQSCQRPDPRCGTQPFRYLIEPPARPSFYPSWAAETTYDGPYGEFLDGLSTPHGRLKLSTVLQNLNNMHAFLPLMGG
jgi:hypothetical protein